MFVPVALTCPVTAAPQDLAGEQQEQWQDGLHQLKDLGMDDALAEKCLKRGFGWSSQAYWWKDKVNDVPKPGEVNNLSPQMLKVCSYVSIHQCFAFVS